jgi:hypothetical protein
LGALNHHFPSDLIIIALYTPPSQSLSGLLGQLSAEIIIEMYPGFNLCKILKRGRLNIQPQELLALRISKQTTCL